MFYYWGLKSLISVTLTPLVVLFGKVGVRRARRDHLGAVIYAWVVAMIIFVFLTPGAQETHWNYQVPLIPIGEPHCWQVSAF